MIQKLSKTYFPICYLIYLNTISVHINSNVIAYMHTLSACSNLWSSHNLNCKLLTADHYLYKKLWVDSASAQVNKSIKVLKCC